MLKIIESWHTAPPLPQRLVQRIRHAAQATIKHYNPETEQEELDIINEIINDGDSDLYDIKDLSEYEAEYLIWQDISCWLDSWGGYPIIETVECGDITTYIYGTTGGVTDSSGGGLTRRTGYKSLNNKPYKELTT